MKISHKKENLIFSIFIQLSFRNSYVCYVTAHINETERRRRARIDMTDQTHVNAWRASDVTATAFLARKWLALCGPRTRSGESGIVVLRMRFSNQVTNVSKVPGDIPFATPLLKDLTFFQAVVQPLAECFLCFSSKVRLHFMDITVTLL